MGHKVKVALSILKINRRSTFLGFLKNRTITCDLNDIDTAASTGVKLAMKYVNVSLDRLNVKKTGFFSVDDKLPPIIDAKSGKRIGDSGPTTYLWFVAKVSDSHEISEKINWISVSNYDELVKIPMYKFHLESMTTA